MALATFRIVTNDPSSPKDIPLSSLIGNEAQTASCDVDSVTDPFTVAEGEKTAQTLAEANALALAEAEESRGVCTWENEEQTVTCPPAYSGGPFTIAAGTPAHTSQVSQAAANASALAAAQALADAGCVLDVFEPPPITTSGQYQEVGVDDDLKILIGGSFVTTIGASTFQSFMRTEPHGEPDATFAEHTTGVGGVTRIKAGLNGATWATGNILEIDGAPWKRLALFDSDGVLVGSDPDLPSEALGLAIQADGKALVCGINYIRRYNTNGTLDGTFSCTVTGTVNALWVRADGKILVGGNGGASSMNFGGTTRHGMALLESDGTLDVTYNPIIQTSGVTDVIEIASGKVYVAGILGFIGGVAYGKSVARLNADGTRDTGFDADNTGSSTSGNRIIVQPDGKVVGNFTGGSVYVRRWNTDGTHDTTFACTPDSDVFGLTMQGTDFIVLVGQFNNVNGVANPDIARVDLLGALT